MSKFFSELQKRIYKFIETDIPSEESKETYTALKTEIHELSESDFKNHSNHFFQMLDCHHERHVKGVTFDDFMSLEFPAPTIRVGRLPVNFNKENYDFMKTLAKNTKMTVQELADFMWWNKYYPQLNIDIDTGEIIQIDTRSRGRTFNFSKIPDISKLKKLKKINISHVTDKVIDFTKIALKSLYLKKLCISCIDKVEKIILTGTIEECEFEFVENLKTLDCTRIDLLDSYFFTSFYCKNNGPCIITDAQRNHPSPFSKFRWKKELVTSTAEEIDTLAACYNWDNGTKFLRWAIRQPQCDKGTALNIYWHGAPEWYSQFASKKEAPDWSQDGYALLAAIEKRIKKDDFATYDYKFNVNKHLNNKAVNYPENKVRDIPEFMFVND